MKCIKVNILFFCFSILVIGCAGSQPDFNNNGILLERDMITNLRISTKTELVSTTWNNQTIDVLYKLGEVKNMFVGFVGSAHYNGGQDDKVTITAANSVSEIKTKTETSVKKTIVNFNASLVGNLNYKNVYSFDESLDANLKVTYDYSNLNEQTKATYESNKFTNDISWSRELDFSKYEEGHYYAAGLFRDFDVYQTLSISGKTKEIIETNLVYGITSSVEGIQIIKSKANSLDFVVDEKAKFKPIEQFNSSEFKSFLVEHKKDIPSFTQFTIGNKTEQKISPIDMSWTQWETLDDITNLLNQKINFEVMRILEYTLIHFDYTLEFEFSGTVEYEIALVINENIYMNSEPIISQKSKESKTIKLGLINDDRFNSKTKLEYKIRWRKTTIFFGHFTIEGNRGFKITYI